MEFEYFRSFRYFEPDVQSGIIIEHADRGPGPDFRVRVGDKVIGIEVTRLITPLANPAIESSQDRILDQACSNAERLNLPPACVTLFFNLRRPLGHADHTRIANAVVQVVAGNMPADGDTVELEGRPGQPPEVDLILVNRRYPRDLGRWGCMEVHAIERNISCIVQKSITKKTDRLPMYRDCDECWLLLVGDSFVASGNLEVGEAFDTNAFSTSFGRTYLLDFGRGYLFRLDESGRFAR